MNLFLSVDCFVSIAYEDHFYPYYKDPTRKNGRVYLSKCTNARFHTNHSCPWRKHHPFHSIRTGEYFPIHTRHEIRFIPISSVLKINRNRRRTKTPGGTGSIDSNQSTVIRPSDGLRKFIRLCTPSLSLFVLYPKVPLIAQNRFTQISRQFFLFLKNPVTPKNS